MLKQRNALLKQAGGTADPTEVASTLDVWDAKLAQRGRGPGRGPRGASWMRRWPALVRRLRPPGRAQRRGRAPTYRSDWLEQGLAWAL